MEDTVPGTTIRLCGTPEEISECLRLVNTAYTIAGLQSPHCATCDLSGKCGGLIKCIHERRTAWHGIAGTVVVRADRDDQLTATVTCVFDDPFIRLPSWGLFADQITERFRVKDILAEITCLASSPEARGLVVPRMLRFARDWLFTQGVDAIIGCIHPHHIDFWRRFMGAEFPHQQIVRQAGHVGDALAVFGYMLRPRDRTSDREET
jgi:hypothetical protein